MHSRPTYLLRSAALALALAALVAAQHGHEDAAGMNMGGMAAAEPEPEPVYDVDDPWHQSLFMESYFRHGHYTSWMVSHILLMIAAWVIAMPLAIMLSIARSRWHLPAQLVFHALNGVGVFSGFVYNHATPNLYKGNAHHPLGWVLTGLTVAWTVMSLYVAYGEYANGKRASTASGRTGSSPNMSQYEQLHQHYNDEVSPTRMSRDSGLGGSRQNSSESIFPKPSPPAHQDIDLDHGDDDEEEKGAAAAASSDENRGFLGNNRVDRFVSKNVLRFSTARASRVVRFVQIVLEKLLLILGFVALTTGFVTYGGIFRSRQVFSGAAHYVKGGIFFFYGLLTLGRWMGAFAEFGWAWNLRPAAPAVAKWKTRVPSAEFTESFVIWLYGASNVFLEHLGNAGGDWSPQDFEHVSITVLFFGGGLLGMLIESVWIRELLSTSVLVEKDRSEGQHEDPQQQRLAAAFARTVRRDDNGLESVRWAPPASYRIPMNPMPALTIMLLGMMMSSHHQHSMVSTMLHAQWGGLFSAFAVARGVTYISVYLRPPTTHFATRPPSELVAAFCLTSGGLIFMNSAADSVWSIESNGLDAMTVFTITMGLTGVLLAWEVLVFAVKGWAIRQERRAAGRPLV